MPFNLERDHMMKTLISTMVLTVLTVGCGREQVGSTAHATESELIGASLETLYLDEGLGIGRTYGASVSISDVKKEILVQITTCPPNELCQVTGQEFAAKLLKKSFDSCGATKYIAQTDRRLLDGMLIDIQVIDHSTAPCERNSDNMTEVYLRTSFFSQANGEEIKTTSLLVGRRRLLPLKKQ